MTTNELKRFLHTLNTKRPLRVFRHPSRFVIDNTGHFVDTIQRDIDSIEWKTVTGEWEHLVSIPRGNIYKHRDERYRSDYVNRSHNSLQTIYNKLITKRLLENPRSFFTLLNKK